MYFWGAGDALSFFESYLKDREQVVSVLGFESSSSTLSCGVPQGSVLGPVLFILYAQPLSDIVERHSFSYHMYADDTQLYKSVTPNDRHYLFESLQSCVSDVKLWMVNNNLQLNEDETELILVPGSSKSIQFPHYLNFGQNQIPFSDSARNLGVILDGSLSMKEQVCRVCQLCYLELRRIGSIRRYLSKETTKTLVTSFVLSRLDYCNSLLVGLPQTLLLKLQKVQNSAARLVCKASRHDHITPLLQDLHWLPISARIEYKISTLCYHIVRTTAPSYLSDLLQLYSPSRDLRSAADNRIFCVPRRHKKQTGERAFSYIAPVIWNNLPFSVRHAEDSAAFKKLLKTHLFSVHF